MLEQALKQKLAAAEKQGDQKTVAVIVKKIEEKKKPTKKKTEVKFSNGTKVGKIKLSDNSKAKLSIGFKNLFEPVKIDNKPKPDTNKNPEIATGPSKTDAISGLGGEFDLYEEENKKDGGEFAASKNVGGAFTDIAAEPGR